jgi:hypothetical protein
MVPKYQMTGGVSTAAAIPPPRFSPLGRHWMVVRGLDVLEDVTINFKGARRVR